MKNTAERGPAVRRPAERRSAERQPTVSRSTVSRPAVSRWVRYLPALTLLVFLVAAFWYREGLHARATVGQASPEFTLPTLHGGELDSTALVGKPVVLNFWTTWCKECRDEVPALQAFHESYGDRVHVIGVNMREPEAVIRPFLERYGATYPIVLDRLEKVKRSYRVTGVPETWVIDGDGIAVMRFIGPVTTEQLIEAVQPLLTSGSASSESPGSFDLFFGGGGSAARAVAGEGVS